MGVYIRGMEMPTSCKDCIFQIYTGTDTRKCKLSGSEFYQWDVGWGDGTENQYIRHKDCPLIEIPDKHGDLIDAQEQMRLMQSCDYDTYDDYNRAFDMLDNAPTIIPAEPCNDLAKPNNNIFVVQDTDEDEGLFAAKPIDYMHTPSVEEIIKGYGE